MELNTLKAAARRLHDNRILSPDNRSTHLCPAAGRPLRRVGLAAAPSLEGRLELLGSGPEDTGPPPEKAWPSVWVYCSALPTESRWIGCEEFLFSAPGRAAHDAGTPRLARAAPGLRSPAEGFTCVVSAEWCPVVTTLLPAQQ